MRSRIISAALPLVLLAGCDMRIGHKDEPANAATVTVGEDGNVSIEPSQGGDGVSLSVPGFNAKINVPGLTIGDKDMDIDGLKLYPGTKMQAIDIAGDTPGKRDGVAMRFTVGAAPAALSEYYADAARANGFSDIKVTNVAAGSTVTARKSDGDRLKIAMAPGAGGGSQGSITIEAKPKD